jgi:hypothetical protein
MSAQRLTTAPLAALWGISGDLSVVDDRVVTDDDLASVPKAKTRLPHKTLSVEKPPEEWGRDTFRLTSDDYIDPWEVPM